MDDNAVNWSEMRTAYMVGELHTLSRTAEHLGVHRSTIMRQITSLETRLGRRVFERGRDGYYPTDFGAQLISVTRQAALDFQDFFLKCGSSEFRIAGSLTIAAPSFLTLFIMRVLAILQEQHANLLYTFFVIDEDDLNSIVDADIVFSLPEHLTHGDFIQKLTTLETSLFASYLYVEKYGMPTTLTKLRDHKFVSDYPSSVDDRKETWLRTNVTARSIVFRSNSHFALYSAITKGVGIGFLPTLIGLDDDKLVQIPGPSPKLETEIWVSIRDRHVLGRNVQLLLEALRQQF